MKKNNISTAKKQKMYRYNKPAAKKDEKAPFILCYANNETHALQIFRERFNGEFIDKSLISEYIPTKKNKDGKTKSSKKR